MKSVRELIYPSEFETGADQVGTNINVQIQNLNIAGLVPSAFKTRELGTIFNITPTIGADHKTVALAMTPEVSLLTKLGFAKHRTVMPSGKIEFSQPDIYCWSLATSLILKSGDTAVVAVLEPNHEDEKSPKDNVVLALVSASVHTID